MTETAAELHERLRLIALEMHGLAGYADALADVDETEDAEILREIIRNVRALIPGTAGPGVITFGWGVQSTAKSGHIGYYAAKDEAEARDQLEFLRDIAGPENAHRHALCHRAIGGWVVVDA